MKSKLALSEKLDLLFSVFSSHEDLKQFYTSTNKICSQTMSMYGSNITLSRRRFSLSPFLKNCSTCDSISTLHSTNVRFSHPIWSDDSFCSECRKKPRCLVCERRISNKPFYLDAATKTGQFSSRFLHALSNGVPLWVCGECNASGLVEHNYNVQSIIDDVTKFLQTDSVVNMNFHPNIEFEYKDLEEKQNTKTLMTKCSIPIFIADIHTLSFINGQSNVWESPKSSNNANKINSALVFGKFEVKNRTFTLTQTTILPLKIHYLNTLSSCFSQNDFNESVNTISLPIQNPSTYLNNFFGNLTSLYLKQKQYVKKFFTINSTSSSMTSLKYFSPGRSQCFPQHFLFENVPSTFQKNPDYVESKKPILTLSKNPSSRMHHGNVISSLKHKIFNKIKCITIAKCLPVDIFASTLAHEITHAFLFLSKQTLPLIYEEGLCNAICIYYVLSFAKIYTNYVNALDAFYNSHHRCRKKGFHCIKNTDFFFLFLKIFPKFSLKNCEIFKPSNMSSKSSNPQSPTHSFVNVPSENISCLVLLRILRERIVLKQRLCVYRCKRILFSDTNEYLAATFIFHAFHQCGFFTILNLLTRT